MRRALIATILLLGLGVGQALVPVATVQAAETAASTTKGEQDWLAKLNTKIDLAQAKVAVLRAKIALEIEKSPERAKRALDDAEARLLEAKEEASAEVSKRIDSLLKDVRAARAAVTGAPATARQNVNELVENIEERIQGHGKTVLETDEAKLLKKRYAQLEAQAALLKAQLAEKADKTGKQAISYLDKAKAWYAEAKANASKKWHDTLTATSDRIDAAKETVQNRREKAGEAIVDLAKRAADLVRGEKR